MKIGLISDTHGFHRSLQNKFPIPECDILIHAGDISNIGEQYQVEDFVKWYSEQSAEYKIFVLGNHDRCGDAKFSYLWNAEGTEKILPPWWFNLKNNLPKGVIYLENSGIDIEGINIWGSPTTPWFHGDSWAFNKHRGEEIEQTWDQIPVNTDILITHGPAKHFVDYEEDSQTYVGCEDLKRRIDIIKPTLHISGHIHSGRGYSRNSNTEFINASILNNRYEMVNKPILIEYNEDGIELIDY